MSGRITGKSQKNQNVPDFTEEEARAYFEKLRWGDTPACVHCGSANVYRVGGSNHRPGLIECRDCRKQCTVTLGTVMEDSHLPLSTWAKAFHLICSSKKGMSALQLQRNLGIGSYRTAWFLAHRIREAMRCEPIANMLKDQVQVDETYVGGKPRKGTGKHRRGRGTVKTPVVALVESRPGGRAHAQPIERVDAKTLRTAMQKQIHPTAQIVTDDLNVYPMATDGFTGGHETVCHSAGEYSRDGFNTNSAESWFSLFKRGVYGTFHHISRQHMHRYCDEFSFRWGGRTLLDSERRDEAVKGAEGKRLYYRQPLA